jgi:hypothetical protein
MITFSHIGMTTDSKMEGETWVEKTKVWVTDFTHHPFSVEWLRYAPDSPVTGPVRERPHIGFNVDDIEKTSKGLKVLLEPFAVSDSLRVGFYEYADGTVVELAENRCVGK